MERKSPNMWEDDDEFSRARRAKFQKHMDRFVDDLKKTRPEPKDVIDPSEQAPRNEED